MRASGISSVLALRGDAPRDQTEWTPAPDGLSHASDLVRLLREEFEFAVGAACHPEKHPEAPDPATDLAYLRRKVDAGAEFLITQLFFDNTSYFTFVQRAREAGIMVPIVPGIMPITNVDQIERITKLCGAVIPAGLQQALDLRRGNDRAVAGLRRRLRHPAVRRAAAQGRPRHPLLHAQPVDRDGLDPACAAAPRAVAADVNRLARETSPYLLQHASNPVDWYAWGEEAFAAARDRDVPILLSIGYSACHWCHVMEHESFSDEAVAELMNRLYVSVKVDREERPDVDAIYMDAVVSLTGSGGWPMTVFLTPDGRPFWGGTYFPPEPRHGMPVVPPAAGGGRRDVPRPPRRGRPPGRSDDARDRHALVHGGETGPSADLVEDAIAALARQFDGVHGGFGGAPKFPPSALLPLLLAHDGAGRAMAVATLDAMADGGIHDQLGGGFHRYTVDGRWLVPHFEKMLYDNALLARAYATAFTVTGRERYAAVARGVLAYLDREMALEGGGIASAQDADTDGHEGLTFVWTPAEVRAALADDALADEVCAWYGITEAGNFEGSNVLSVVAPGGRRRGSSRHGRRCWRHATGGRSRPATTRRWRPGTGWPSPPTPMPAACSASRRTSSARASWRRSCSARCRRTDGCCAHGATAARRSRGFSEDYGAVADGLLALHRATGELRWLDEARRLALLAVDLFGDTGGAFQQTARDGERLVARRPDVDDNPAPSGNSLLAGVLLQLARLYGEHSLEERAIAAVATVGRCRRPRAAGVRARAGVDRGGHRDAAGDRHRRRPRRRPHDARCGRCVDGRYAPGAAVAIADPADPLFATVPLLDGRTTVDGRPAAYVCERFACRRPVTEPDELAAAPRGELSGPRARRHAAPGDARAMTYRIARDALVDFVDRQIHLIESTPLPPDLRALVPDGDVGDDELSGVWLGAGLATQLGLAIVDRPEVFVERA